MTNEFAPARPEIASGYDEWHRRMGAGSGDPLRFPWYAAAAEGLGDKLTGDLLEVGCGRGEFAVWLAETSENVQITGVDFSSAAIEIAKQRTIPANATVRFSVGDAQRLAFPDNAFDWVVSCECMEHVPAPRAMAAEIFRVLKSGGKFCLTTENYFNGMLVAWLRCWATRQPFNSGSGVQPIENFSVFFQVQRYLHDAGLIVDRTASSHYQWLLLPRIDPAKLCTYQFKRGWLRRFAKPFGRHFSFFGHKP